MWPLVKFWTLPLAVGAAYFIAAEVGEVLAFPSAPVSVLWAPNAILMAALMLTPREHWWLYLTGVLPFHLFSQLGEFPLSQVAIQYFANVGLAMLGALAVAAFTPHPHRFDRVRTALTLVVFGGLLAPALTSILMAAFFKLSGISSDMWLTVVARTVTNTFAVVTLVPLTVHCAERLRSGQRPISVKRAAEAMTLTLTTLAVCILLFFIPFNSPERTLAVVVCAIAAGGLGHDPLWRRRRLCRLPDRGRGFHARHGQWLRAADGRQPGRERPVARGLPRRHEHHLPHRGGIAR